MKNYCVEWHGCGYILPRERRSNVACVLLEATFKRMNRTRLHVFYSGHVQGVGFRYTTKNVAMGYEVTGIVRNLPDGRVELIAEGQKQELKEFQQAIRDAGLGSLISQEEESWSDAKNEFRGFEIVR